jgi:hypothetical protein
MSKVWRLPRRQPPRSLSEDDEVVHEVRIDVGHPQPEVSGGRGQRRRLEHEPPEVDVKDSSVLGRHVIVDATRRERDAAREDDNSDEDPSSGSMGIGAARTRHGVD